MANQTLRADRFRAKVRIDQLTGCHEWTGALRPDGYGSFGDVVNGKWFTFRAHRWIWTFFNGPIPEGLLICHRCDNRRCVNVDHLFLGTHKDNSIDCRDKNRKPRSNPHGFTAADIAAIRTSKKSTRFIAKEFGASQTCIVEIRAGRHWRFDPS